MNNRVLLDTLAYLGRLVFNVRLTALHLTRFFTVAILDDSSTGAAMSYYTLSDEALWRLERYLMDFCGGPIDIGRLVTLQDKLGTEIEDSTERAYIAASVMTSIASALSSKFIRAGGDECFQVIHRLPTNWTKGAESALVVGFGGFLEPLIETETMKEIHVVDLRYERKKDEFSSQIQIWKQNHPCKMITASAEVSHETGLRKFDLLSITGSTLCNGTLEFFLSNVREDAIVILQGQSASLYPQVLFQSGVQWVATTLKPATLGTLARERRDGAPMRPLLQGGLPWLYLFPRVVRHDSHAFHCEDDFNH